MTPAKPALSLVLSMIAAAGILSLAIVSQLQSTEAGAAVTGPVTELPPSASVASGGIQVSGALDRTAIHSSGDRKVRMELILSNDDAPSTAPRAPTDLIVIVDRSGSMSGGKLLDAKTAALELISLLGEEDRFSLVTYSNSANVRIDLDYATDDAQKRWRAQVDGISAGGGTHMQAGLQTAMNAWEKQPGRVMRTILISDGLPDSKDGLMNLASRSATMEIPLTTVGIGLDYDEQLMTELADAGTGNFYWTQRGADLASAFATEFDAARETVASQVAVAFRSDNGTTLSNTAGYPMAGGKFEIGSLISGQERRLWVTLNLAPSYTSSTDPGYFELSWYDVHGARHGATVPVPVVEVTRDSAQAVASLDRENWERAVLNEEYNVMQTALSQQVQAGNRDSALHVIETYRERNAVLNGSVGSAAVADNIAGLDQLEAEVRQQFVGENQSTKQNFWAKTRNETAYNGRRNLK